MRIIIAGSRSATEAQVAEALARCPWIGFATAVISGTARGADQLGEAWAAARGVAVTQMPADWARYGRGAGHARNKEMAALADALVAVWDGASRGTQSIINLARARGLRICIYRTGAGNVELIEATGELAQRWEVTEERAAIKQFDAGLERGQAERTAGAEVSAGPDDAATGGPAHP